MIQDNNLKQDLLSQVTIRRLELPAPEFASLTYPRFRKLLTETDNDQNDAHELQLAIGASINAKPVGLILLSRPYGEKERRLFSVFVSREIRRHGLALELLKESEKIAKANGTRKLIAFHSSQMPMLEPYEALMQKAEWSTPRVKDFRLAGRADWAAQAADDWARFLARIRLGGFASTAWNELTDADRQTINYLIESEIPETDRIFHPLNTGELPLIHEVSIALRNRDGIVGWILGSEGAMTGHVYYSHGYVLPEYQRRGWLIAGMVDVCQRQARLLGPDTIPVYETSIERPDMQRLMEKRMKPYTIWMDKRFLCEKMLD